MFYSIIVNESNFFSSKNIKRNVIPIDKNSLHVLGEKIIKNKLFYFITLKTKVILIININVCVIKCLKLNSKENIIHANSYTLVYNICVCVFITIALTIQKKKCNHKNNR